MSKSTDNLIFRNMREWAEAAQTVIIGTFLVIDEDGKPYYDKVKALELGDQIKLLCVTYHALIEAGVKMPPYEPDGMTAEEVRELIKSNLEACEEAEKNTTELYKKLNLIQGGTNSESEARESAGKSASSGKADK